jgi:selenocysteine lyase/cysteine desulfurase
MKLVADQAKVGTDFLKQQKFMLKQKKFTSLLNIKQSEDVVLADSATHAINVIIKGYCNYQDHVLICNFSHNTALRPIYYLQSADIVTKTCMLIENNLLSIYNPLSG